MTTWWCEQAWLGGDSASAGVLITTEGERLAKVEEGISVPPPGAHVLRGLTLPGLANAHSHAFHRALRGRAQTAGSFWDWREHMYGVAAALEPDTYFSLARAVYTEMALAGITAVGEFHYLHHQPDGSRYADPNAMGNALLAAAAEVGIRITLLDTCYLHGGIDAPLERLQVRFGDGSVRNWADRVSLLGENPSRRVGAAIHSVRAVDPEAIAVVASWAAEHHRPLHAHVSEQPAENEAAAARYGQTPTQLLAATGVLGPHFTAVHATHLTEDDIALLGGSHSTCCLCPTTERDLGDGVGPARSLVEAGAGLALGSDSHAFIDLFEEARGLELHQRLVTGRRGHHSPSELLAAATAGGTASLGWDGGTLEAGRPADFIAVDIAGHRLAGTEPLTGVVFSATAADVADVVVGGRLLVAGGSHLRIGDVAREMHEAVAAVDSRLSG